MGETWHVQRSIIFGDNASGTHRVLRPTRQVQLCGRPRNNAIDNDVYTAAIKPVEIVV